MENLFRELPTERIVKALDDVLIDYSIMSVLDQQHQTAEEAVENIRTIKRLRDSIKTRTQ